MPRERRRDQRYIPAETAYAALGTAYLMVGRICDFSKGGLSFEYLAEQHPEMETSKVAIFLTDDTFHIHRLPCEMVYDIEPQPGDDQASTFEELVMHRCGVRFVARSDNYKDLIAAFISNHTLGRSASRRNAK